MKLNLHHTGMLVKDVRRSAPFYVEMGYELMSEVFHDPVQTAYVQFLRLPNDRVYLELVSPDRADSKLSNALEKGGGLNHLCYSTVDIEAACEYLRTTGFFPISAPIGAVAFGGRRVAWFRGPDRLLVELVESGGEGEL
jgi:methylmalonyl-CoA/ethylmalonyl-CoA epimerase